MACPHNPVTFQTDYVLHAQFELHVLNTCVRNDFPPTYFSTGIAEECVEFIDVLNKILKGTNSKAPTEVISLVANSHEGKEDSIRALGVNQSIYKLALSEAGDILWYLYALSLSLPGGKWSSVAGPTLIKGLDFSFAEKCHCSSIDQKLDNLKDELCSNMGKLCGSVKKFSRGDQSWDKFQKRIESEISTIIYHLQCILHLLQTYCNQDELTVKCAMIHNIQKIQARKMNNTIKGDGEIR